MDNDSMNASGEYYGTLRRKVRVFHTTLFYLAPHVHQALACGGYRCMITGMFD